MPKADVNGIEIYYETTGDRSALPVLLVSGLAMQLVDWPPSWPDRLAGLGHFVISYDNRDIGLSTHLADAGVPDLLGLLEGRDAHISYGLAEMADDATGLLDHLGIEKAHVVGISMGGMIVQELAIRHPDRLLSLCSIMSTTGNPAVGQPSGEALGTLLREAPKSRDEAAEQAVDMWRVIGSPAYPFDVELESERAAAAYDRSHDGEGVTRQLGAIVLASDRTAALGSVTVPTLVIHGAADPLIDPSGGEATAKAIPGAQLLMVDGMGHDLPAELDDRLLAAIEANAALAAGAPETSR